MKTQSIRGGGSIDGVVHYLAKIDGVGNSLGCQVVWRISMGFRAQAVAKDESDDAGGWKGNVPGDATT